MKIGIVDCGIGNIFSVYNAIKKLGHEPLIVDSPENLSNAEKLIIPGVGTYRLAMERLSGNNLSEAIKEYALNHYILGICLGMQIMSEIGFEDGVTDGLNLIPGKVLKMKQIDGYQLPHIGWNEINKTSESQLFEGIKPSADFYFVHSFHYSCNEEFVLAKTSHGENFTAVISNDDKNIFGTQFHPEKSQKNGLRMLNNFIKI